MLNILIPLAGRSVFFDMDRYHYPTPFIEIAGQLMIERVINNLKSIDIEKQFIFIVKDEDCRKHHIDDVLGLLVDGPHQIIRISNNTAGAACSSLLAIDHINNNHPLLISNGDQILHTNLTGLFDLKSLAPEEARVYYIRAFHPRWSYVVCDAEGVAREVAEKRPISDKAIAGLYLYGQGQRFIQSAMTMIEKSDAVDNNFYISHTLNHHILESNPVNAIELGKNVYHSLYTPERVAEYEEYLQSVFGQST